MTDLRLYAPATARNRQPILEILKRVLPTESWVLEIASGTGEHGVYMCQHMPALTWQPTDINPEAIASINAWREHSDKTRLLAPQHVDVQTPEWWTSLMQNADASGGIQAIVNINMIHISPWAATEGLFRGACELLSPQGILYLYGPYKRQNQHTAESNAQFDQSLQARNPQWGVRNLEDVIALGNQHGLTPLETIEMPANNLSVIFRKA